MKSRKRTRGKRRSELSKPNRSARLKTKNADQSTTRQNPCSTQNILVTAMQMQKLSKVTMYQMLLTTMSNLQLR
jgi:hypothetical protein